MATRGAKATSAPPDDLQRAHAIWLDIRNIGLAISRYRTICMVHAQADADRRHPGIHTEVSPTADPVRAFVAMLSTERFAWCAGLDETWGSECTGVLSGTTTLLDGVALSASIALTGRMHVTVEIRIDVRVNVGIGVSVSVCVCVCVSVSVCVW